MGWKWDAATTTCFSTIVAYDSGPWTMAAKVYATNTGEGGQGYVFAHKNVNNNLQRVQMNGSSNQFGLSGRQSFATTAEERDSPTNNRICHFNQWAWVVAVYDDSLAAGSRFSIWQGTEFVSPVETGAPGTSASGARSTGGTGVSIGNEDTVARTWGGYIEDVMFDTTAWPAAQVMAYWEGWEPFGVSTLRWWLPLREQCDSSTQTPVELGGGLTFTTAAVAQGATCPMAMRRKIYSLYVPAAASVATKKTNLTLIGVG